MSRTRKRALLGLAITLPVLGLVAVLAPPGTIRISVTNETGHALTAIALDANDRGTFIERLGPGETRTVRLVPGTRRHMSAPELGAVEFGVHFSDAEGRPCGPITVVLPRVNKGQLCIQHLAGTAERPLDYVVANVFSCPLDWQEIWDAVSHARPPMSQEVTLPLLTVAGPRAEVGAQ